VLSIKKIKVLIADDHVMVRQGFMVLLNAQPDIEVIGEAADGNEMVELTETLHPDVVLAAISMPNLNGIEATKLIHQRNPEMPVVMVTIHTSSSYVVRALRSGARGYVVKNDDFQHVIQAIKAVSLGQRYLSTLVSEQIIDSVVSGTSGEFNLDERISIREREILQLLAEGNSIRRSPRNWSSAPVRWKRTARTSCGNWNSARRSIYSATPSSTVSPSLSSEPSQRKRSYFFHIFQMIG